MQKQMIGILMLSLLLMSVSNISAYTKTGTIHENGDAIWDDNEITFISFELDKGEKLDISFSSTGNLELMVCDCQDSQDIEDFLKEMVYDGTVPDKLYLWLDSYKYTSGSFIAKSRIDVNIAVFTYDATNPPSMSYSIETNYPSGDRINDGPGVVGWIIIIAVVIAIVYFVKSRSSKKNTTPSPYSNVGYHQSYSQQQQQMQYQQQQQPYPSQTQAAVGSFCSNCGAQVTSKFCTDCGTRID